jgi:hypothetical protein
MRPLPDIWQDIWYPAFGLPRYLAGRISGKISIQCIPSKHTFFIQLTVLEALRVAQCSKDTVTKRGFSR